MHAFAVSETASGAGGYWPLAPVCFCNTSHTAVRNGMDSLPGVQAKERLQKKSAVTIRTKMRQPSEKSALKESRFGFVRGRFLCIIGGKGYFATRPRSFGRYRLVSAPAILHPHPVSTIGCAGKNYSVSCSPSVSSGVGSAPNAGIFLR